MTSDLTSNLVNLRRQLPTRSRDDASTCWLSSFNIWKIGRGKYEFSQNLSLTLPPNHFQLGQSELVFLYFGCFSKIDFFQCLLNMGLKIKLYEISFSQFLSWSLLLYQKSCLLASLMSHFLLTRESLESVKNDGKAHRRFIGEEELESRHLSPRQCSHIKASTFHSDQFWPISESPPQFLNDGGKSHSENPTSFPITVSWSIWNGSLEHHWTCFNDIDQTNQEQRPLDMRAIDKATSIPQEQDYRHRP